MDRDKWVQVLIFDDVTSDLIEVDLRRTAADVLQRIGEPSLPANNESTEPEKHEARHPGRPKLGVVDAVPRVSRVRLIRCLPGGSVPRYAAGRQRRSGEGPLRSSRL